MNPAKNGGQRVIHYESDPNLTTGEQKMMGLLADAINGLAWAHRDKMKRRVGRRYEVTVTFTYPKDGILDIDLFEMRELPKGRKRGA